MNYSVEPARAALLRKGTETDKTVLAKIKEKPGISPKHIAETLNWNFWRVDGSLRRLKKRNQVQVGYSVSNGRALKVLYPTQAEDQ